MSEIKPNKHSDVVNRKEIICDRGLDSANVDLDEIESKLAEELKLICDDDGKEIDPSLSAPILHKLGKVYHQRGLDDILCYIKSAVLLNAAIARSAEGHKPKIKRDLRQLCVDILSQAGARNKDVDLIEQAMKVKAEITAMRNKIERELENIPTVDINAYDITNWRDGHKVLSQYLKEQTLHDLEGKKTASIRKLQQSITKNYTIIMRNLAAFCHAIMGASSCKFSLIGMGSLARQEITPYSDFENIIVLSNEVSHIIEDEKKECIFQYFRWFSIIFQTVLVNLQETIIPSVAVTSLNDFYNPDKKKNWFFDKFTTRGISFDGMMPHACKFPFGRQQPTKEKPWKTELIKPVNEMLEYLNSDVNLKNGYHLGDILTKVCYVYGDWEIFHKFDHGVAKILNNQTEEDNMELIKCQITHDLQKFAIKSTLSQLYLNKELNTKKVGYRSTTLFISAMGRLHSIRASSCFDIIESLAWNQKCSDSAKHKLMYGIALACEIRLRWYMQNKCQNDVIKENLNNTPIVTFSNIIGKHSAFSYFQIAYALQCHISKHLGLKRIHFYSKPQLLNLSLYCCLYDPRITHKILSWNSFAHEQTERLCDFDECLKHLENDTTIKVMDYQHATHAGAYDEMYHLLNAAGNFQSLGTDLQSADTYDDALEYFLKAEKIIIDVKRKLNVFRDSAISSNNGFETTLPVVSEEHTKFSFTTKTTFASILHSLGSCFMELHKPADGVNYFKQWLEIQKELPPNYQYRWSNAHGETLNNIGSCLMEMNDPSNAIDYFEKSKEVQEEASPDAFEPSFDYADTQHKLGLCYFEIDEFSKSLKCLEGALRIRKSKLVHHIDVDSSFAENLHDIGDCLVAMNQSNEAVKYFQESLDIETEAYSIDDENSRTYADSLLKTGSCFLKMNQPEKALEYFQQSLDIKERTSLDVTVDTSLSKTLMNLGKCLIELNESDEAKKQFGRVLEIAEKASEDTKTDKSFASTLHSVGKCLIDTFPMQAKICFEQSQEIIEETSPNAEIDTSVATTLHSIGLYFLEIDKPETAMSYFTRSLQIEERVSVDVETDSNMAVSLQNIGDCLLTVDQPAEAMKYFCRSLPIVKRISHNLEFDTTYANTLHCIGMCLLKLNRTQEARSNFQQSLKTQEQSSVDVESDLACADTKHYIGLCLLKLGKPESAKKFFCEIAKIYERASLTTDDKVRFSQTLSDIGESLLDMNEFSEALKYFKISLQIQEKNIKDKKQIVLVTANTHLNIGKCYLKKNEPTEAAKHFERILHLYKSSASSPDFVHTSLADSLEAIGNAFLENDNPIEAMVHFSRLLQVQEEESNDIESDEGCADTLHNIGLCCLKLKKPTEAMHYLSKSLQIRESLSIDIESDYCYADTLFHIGLSCLELKNISDAMKYFENYQFIMENQATSAIEIDGEYSTNLLNVGIRLLKLIDFTHAMKYVEKSLQIKEHTSEILKCKSEFVQALQKVGNCLLEINKSTDAKTYFDKSHQLQNTN